MPQSACVGCLLFLLGKLGVLGLVSLLLHGSEREKRVESWDEVLKLPHIRLNFGGGPNRHPQEQYKGYVSVESIPPKPYEKNGFGWCVPGGDYKHLYEHGADRFMVPHNGRVDGRGGGCGNWCVCTPVPGKLMLPNNTVERIHSEDCMEHIPYAALPTLFAEFHRVLKPGGRARLSMPDYNNPKDAPYQPNADRADPRNGAHITATTYSRMKKIADASPFRGAHWIHYYDDTDPSKPPTWVQNELDLSLGHVQRAVTVDPRNTPGQPRLVTSLIFDLIKKGGGVGGSAARQSAHTHGHGGV